ncbi:MAG TPA: MFS transporter [Candidatus Saccharimonadales bacterium]|jgi:MFS family permease
MKNNPAARSIQRIYLTLTLLSTLAASFIWGINTLFLLDAGLSNTQAFAANAFFTLGMVIFEVPTGVVADTKGRRASYLLGASTLLVTTLAYLWLWQISGPFWVWAAVSALLGLGFTFFSGATEAWLVDGLKFAKYDGDLDSVFGRGQSIGGVAMLVGSASGGIIAQATNLGVPYLLRAGVLLVTLLVAALFMKDLGFKPRAMASPLKDVRELLKASMDNGWRQPSVRWMMLSSPFTAGVGIYAFYAMQPYLLELYGNPEAYSVAGLAAAIIASAQIAGGLLVSQVRKLFKYRTSLLITATMGNVGLLIILGLSQSFALAIGILVIWAMLFAMTMPVRQTYLNGLIDSDQRATVLSFDSLVGSSGGVVTQPVLGRVADVYGYGASYLVSGLVQAGCLPFLLLAKKTRASSDPTVSNSVSRP